MNKLNTTLGCFIVALLAQSSAANAVKCLNFANKNYELAPKTITIYNNSESTIYPVISMSENKVNEWLQGCFRDTSKNYPTEHVYKLYINEDKGLPSGSSVEVTLPLYSQLSENDYITWWNGGRVVLADKPDKLRNEEDKSLGNSVAGVSCTPAESCNLSFYSSKVEFPTNVFAQLSEYTFGDSIIPPCTEEQSKANQCPKRLLKPENVGYNISYVDHVYLPVAIGPKGNPYIGYSGSTLSFSDFRGRLERFLEKDGKGWPIYNLGTLGSKDNIKLPGGYNIFAQRTGTLLKTDDVPVKPENPDAFPPVLTVLQCLEGQCNEDEKKSLHFGKAVQDIQNLWASCVVWDEDVNAYKTAEVTCPNDLKKKLTLIKDFFKANHDSAGGCGAPFNFMTALQHIYGWVPYNEGCDANVNPLKDTVVDGKTHGEIQAMYIKDLQYNYDDKISQNLVFNPYVELIHSKEFLDMDSYAFSVDDAVGFMSELGKGLIFTVGSGKGLENNQKFNYADGFSVAIGTPKAMTKPEFANSPLIKKYGVCSGYQCKVKQDVIMPSYSQISGFRVGTMPSYPITVAFTDMDDNVYTFVVNQKFEKCAASSDGKPHKDGSNCAPANREAIRESIQSTCSVKKPDGSLHPKSKEWCENSNPNESVEAQLTKNYLSFQVPVRCKELKDPNECTP